MSRPCPCPWCRASSVDGGRPVVAYGSGAGGVATAASVVELLHRVADQRADAFGSGRLVQPVEVVGPAAHDRVETTRHRQGPDQPRVAEGRERLQELLG